MKQACCSACTASLRQRLLVQRRDVPDVEAGRPQRQRDQRVGQHPQPVDRADRQQRLQQRAGQPEHDQQRGDVADHQVLGHVGQQQLLPHVRQRRHEPGDDQQDSGGEAEDAPGGHRATLAGQRLHPERVGRRRHRHGDELKRFEGPASDMPHDRRHRAEATAGLTSADARSPRSHTGELARLVRRSSRGLSPPTSPTARPPRSRRGPSRNLVRWMVARWRWFLPPGRMVVQVVCKLNPPDPRVGREAVGLAGWPEICPELLATRDDEHTILMERLKPGTLLAESGNSIDAQLTVIGALARRLHLAGPEDVERFADSTLGLELLGALEHEHERAELRDLMAADDVVVHTDLHALNVLDAGDGDWRVIDPEPLRAAPEAEIWALMDATSLDDPNAPAEIAVAGWFSTARPPVWTRSLAAPLGPAPRPSRGEPGHRGIGVAERAGAGGRRARRLAPRYFFFFSSSCSPFSSSWPRRRSSSCPSSSSSCTSSPAGCRPAVPHSTSAL